MEEQKIREAIDIAKGLEENSYTKDEWVSISRLIALAESVLAAGESLPDKQDITKFADGMGYNRAIDLCALSVTKNYVRKDSLPTEEEIFDIAKREWSETKDFYDIAEAIHDRLLEGVEK